ncbi:hypothetical protein K493DRAFT_54152, partial [Basidiobolus meristosporus CBS 931.73]
MHRPTAQLLIAAAFLARAAVDATLAFTAPLGATWNVGTKHTISWTDNGDGKESPETVNFYLVNGNADALQLVATIASGVNTESGSYEWTIPANIAPGQYAIRANENLQYSPFFTISEADSKPSSAEPTSTVSSSSASSSSPKETSTSASTSTSTSTSTTASTSTSSSTSNTDSSSTATSEETSDATTSTPTESTSTDTDLSSTSSILVSSPSVASSTSESSEELVSSTADASSSEAAATSTPEPTSATSLETSSTTEPESSTTPVPTEDAQNGVGRVIPSVVAISAAMILGFFSNLA